MFFFDFWAQLLVGKDWGYCIYLLFCKFILLVSNNVNLWYDANSKDFPTKLLAWPHCSKQFDLLKMTLNCQNQVPFTIGFHRNMCIVCVFWEITIGFHWNMCIVCVFWETWKWWKHIHQIGWHQQDNRNKGKYNERYH